MAQVKPIPDGYPMLTPYLVVDGADAAIRFYTQVFGARERMRLAAPGNKIGHAELEIGTSLMMLADEYPEMDARGPRNVGGSPVTLSLYVEAVDAVVERAIRAGAKLVRPAADQFYGDRSATIEDPFGHRWSLATHIEDISPEEMRRRMAEMAQRGQENSQ